MTHEERKKADWRLSICPIMCFASLCWVEDEMKDDRS